MDAPKNYELAETDYIAGAKYREIADKYGVSLDTVKSWKKRYAWSRTKAAPAPKKPAPKTQKCVHTKAEGAKVDKEAIAEAVDAVLDNRELNDQQRLFCLYYTRYFSAAKAYQKAYPDASHDTAVVNGCKLMQRPEVQAQIRELKKSRMCRELFDMTDLFEMYLEIATVDMNDYADFGPSGIRLHKSDRIDGRMIKKVSEGQYGVNIEIHDRMAAMKWLGDHMGMATEEQKARIEALRSKNIKDNEGPEQKVTEYINALREAVRNEPE
nr:MAG TPA: Terminase small subunit [Caudoviricetes sp.]